MSAAVRFLINPRSAEVFERVGKTFIENVASDLAKDIQRNARSSKMRYARGYATSSLPSKNGARITINSSFWHWSEWGTPTTKAFHPIGRALSHPRIRWEDDGAR